MITGVNSKIIGAILAGWLLAGVVYVLYVARTQWLEIEAELAQQSSILHRTISQRADQHDAHLTSLSALATAAGDANRGLLMEVAATIRQFYPRIAAIDLVSLGPGRFPMITRQGGSNLTVIDKSIRAAARRSTGELVLLVSPEAASHYLIVKRSPNSNDARYGLALEIDAASLMETDAAFWAAPNASLTLAMPDGSVLWRKAPLQADGGIRFLEPVTESKVLGSRSQPLLFTTALAPGVADILPPKTITLGLAAILALLAVAGLLARQGLKLRSAERRARLGEHGARIAHASRINALGEMASGMAHELTQPLTAILSQSQAGLRLLSSESPQLAAIGSILDANVAQARRSADILSRLRRWSEKAPLQSNPVSLVECVNSVAFLLTPDLQRLRISMSVTDKSGGQQVAGDAVEIEQVVFNLMRNAIDALERECKPGSRIDVRIADGGRQAVLEIADNGPGIAPAMRPRLFEPFATDKAGGMGLGLALCERIVERMGGLIDISDGAAAGAVVRITLPAATTAQVAP